MEKVFTVVGKELEKYCLGEAKSAKHGSRKSIIDNFPRRQLYGIFGNSEMNKLFNFFLAI